MIALPGWLLIVPILGFLVLIHELGHFAAAKLFRIRVTEFAFGLPVPPRLIGVSWRGTLYSVYWLPFGGFVRLVGEEDPTHPESFARQSILKRVVVLVAGSAMNLAFPVVVFTVFFMLPHDVLLGGEVRVSSVAPSSPAAEAGFRPGDTILSVDGRKIVTTEELVDAVKDKVGRSVELGLRRSSVITGIPVSPEFMVFDSVTLVPRLNPPRLTVVAVVTDTGTQVSLKEAQSYDRELEIGDTMLQGAIGVRIGIINPKIGQKTAPIWEAVPASFMTIWNVFVFTWDGITEGVTTRSNPGLAGPIGIAHATEEVVSELGISWVFQLTALLSISLGIVNVLPFPALDGGRVVFVLLEWVRGGRRVSPKMESLVHLVGFAVLVAFIALLSYADIMRILKGESLLR